MAHSEAEIRRAIKPLLTIYGELNTSEIKSLLHTVLEFDEEDRILSKTRRAEMLIIQRIGNIVAHQSDEIKTYKEGFVLDKKASPAKFKLINSLTQQTLQPSEINVLKEKTKKFTAKKIDWEKARDRNNEIGDQGEEFVMEYEIDRLTELLSTDATQFVQHLSRLQGDGLGYDISSINEDGYTRFIEVKTTSGNFSTPFYMSKNEKAFFEEYKDSAYIYRVYEFNRETRRGKVKVISRNELFADFNFDPITWQVTPK